MTMIKFSEELQVELVDARIYKKQIKHLYKTAFPIKERLPLPFLFHKTKNDASSFYAAVDNNEFVGFAYVIRYKNLVYINYLAIEENKRGNGYGTEILRKIKDIHPDCIITLLIEDTDVIHADNYDERIRRLDFYTRNGYEQLHVKVTEIGVKFELLGTEKKVTQSDYLKLMKNFLGRLFFKIIYITMKN